MVQYSTALPQPDPNWTYTDHAGHEHAYGTKNDLYPTLAKRQSEEYWCTDCQDEHVDMWLECPLCGEKITPGTYVDTSPQYLPGLASYRINGQEVPPEEGESLLAQVRAEREAAARRKAATEATTEAARTEQVMRAEGFTDEQIARVVDRLHHGNTDGPHA